MPRNRRLKKLAHRKRSQKARRARRLRHEPLERRDLLAVITVDTELDVVDINDGVTSLREAVFAANTVPGADEIVFDFGFDGPATIVLTEGELQVTDSLTITGDGPELLTIDASGSDPTPDLKNSDGSRVFSIRDFNSNNTLEVTIQGVTLTGGDAAGDGGAIVSSEALTIVDSVITENHAGISGGGVSSYTFTGDLVIRGSVVSGNSTGIGNGGGVSAGRLVMENSQVTDNVADFSGGGIALAGRQSTIRNSQITGNETIRGAGGGISLTSTRGGTPTLLLTGSVVSDNTAAAEGGGIRSSFSSGLTIHESHIARNHAGDLGGGLAAFSSAVLVLDSSFDSNVTERQGGGIASYTSGTLNRPFEIVNSTIARNRAEVNGGGVYVEARGLVDFAVRHSTVVDNEVDLDLGELNSLLGGGIVAANTEVVLDHTIVFDNSVFGGPSDLTAIEGSFTVESSAIGVIAPGTPAFLNNTQLGIDPLLSGPLGGVGPTLVYALQPGSPAIDAGDPALIAGMDGVPAFDQRGPFFFRQQGVIDIGAYEVQPEGLGDVDADFNRDGTVSGSDFLILQRNLGATGLGEDSILFGDADGDRDVDRNDLLAWEYLFGKGEVEAGGPAAALAIEGEEPPPVVLVTTDSDVVDFDDGVTSLREAIFATNIVSGLQEIQFAFLVAGPVSIVLTEGELRVEDELIVTGNSADLLTIDASGSDPTPDSTLSDGDSLNDGDGSRVFFIGDGDYSSNFDVTLQGITITGGDTRGVGGGVRSAENLWLIESRVIGNQVGPAGRGGSSGGGVGALGPLTVERSWITDNEAISFGGGVSVDSGDFVMRNSTISGNSARNGGGAHARARGYAVEITGSTFSGNHADLDGGGLAIDANDVPLQVDEVQYAEVLVEDTGFNQNTSEGIGGAIALNLRGAQGGIVLRGVDAVANRADLQGGAVSVQGIDSDVTIEGGTFSNNIASQAGGGLSILETSSPQQLGLHVTVDGSTFRSNTTDGDGGGIEASLDIGTLTVQDAAVLGNQAQTGGGIFVQERDGAEAVTIDGSLVSGNFAESFGGGVWVGEGGLVVEDSEILSNTAGNGGGGLLAQNLTLTDSTVEVNLAEDGFGGGVLVAEDAVIVGSSINRNRAALGGGGVALGVGESLVSLSTIEGNEVVNGDGGGVFVSSGESLLIEDTSIRWNTATEDGGGMYSFFTPLVISGSTFARNEAGRRGGGVYHLAAGGASDDYVNSTFTENHADYEGGGIYHIGRGAAELSVRHSTVYGNTAGNLNFLQTGAGGGVFTPNSTIYLDHSIFYRNLLDDGDREDIAETSGQFFVDWSLIGTIGPGTQAVLNNTLLGINPLLIDAVDNGGPTPTHRLFIDSPAIDAGNPALVPGQDGVPEFDQRGEPFDRVYGSAIDIGAYESQPYPEDFTLGLSAVADDMDGDGVVDVADLLAAQRDAPAAARAVEESTGPLVAPTVEDDVPVVLVTTTADVVDFNDGVTSLREAIFATNTVPGLQKIEFLFPFLDPLGQATLVLTEGELVVTDSLIIDGGAAELITIDASGNDPTPDEDNGDGSRVMRVEAAGSDPIDVTLRGLTLTGGDINSLGGAVFSSSNLLLDGVAVEDNRAIEGGGIYSRPVNGAFGLTIAGSTLSGNRASGGGRTNGDGGAVSVRGGLHVEDSVFSENRAWNGAGVAARDHEVTISGSTFVGNQATNNGGGLSFVQTLEESEIVGSTFSGNEAFQGGGMFVFSRGAAPTLVRHSTFTDNRLLPLPGGVPGEGQPLSGAGIAVVNRGDGGGFRLDHTVVAGNFNGNGQADDFLVSSSSSQPLAEVESSLIGVIAPGTQAVLNNTLLGFDPLLGPLQDNGGTTPTHAPSSGSPAVDAGDPSLAGGVDGVPAFDQRGAPFYRVFGDAIDIGAYEVQPEREDLSAIVDDMDGDFDHDVADLMAALRARTAPPIFTQALAVEAAEPAPLVLVDTEFDTTDLGDDALTLREAIFATNTVPGFEQIQFAFDVDGPVSIVLTEGQIEIDDDLFISGDSADLLTIDASGSDPTPNEKNGDGSRVFDIRRFQNIPPIDVTIRGVTLTGGDSLIGGGAIITSQNLTLLETVVTQNHAELGAGGIFSYNPGVLTVRDSIISHNSSAVGRGGGVEVNSLVMETSEVSENSAGRSGGGVAINSTATIADSRITGNRTEGGGGGISIYARRNLPNLLLTGSTVADNSSASNGGGISTNRSVVTIEDSLITRNRTDEAGGGLWSSVTELNIRGTTFDSNEAQRTGGAITLFTSGREFAPADIVNSTLSRNTAELLGGGIYADTREGSPLAVRHSTFIENRVIDDSFSKSGGGIYNNAGEVSVDHTILWDNSTAEGPEDLSARADQASFAVDSSLVGVIAPGTPATVNNTLLGFDPLLGPLQDNGGPTPTHAPSFNSPVIDAGDASGLEDVPLFDQRGAPFDRVSGPAIDIGAFEVQQITHFEGQQLQDQSREGDRLAALDEALVSALAAAAYEQSDWGPQRPEGEEEEVDRAFALWVS